MKTGKLSQEAEPLRKSRSWWWLLAGMLIVVIYAIPWALTSSPKACGSCHQMKPYYDSWRTSSHRAAAPNCLSCHVKPGALNLVVYRFMFYREIAAAISGQELKPLETVAPDGSSCSRAACHSANRRTSTSGRLRIDHRVHVTTEGIPCERCHPGAVHKNVAGRDVLPAMDICDECHAAKMNDCAYCHIGRPPVAPNAHSGASVTSATPAP